MSKEEEFANIRFESVKRTFPLPKGAGLSLRYMRMNVDGDVASRQERQGVLECTDPRSRKEDQEYPA